MSTFRAKKLRPLSPAAVRVLRAIITISDREHRAVTLDDLAHLESAPNLLNRIHVLDDRWLIAIDGRKIRPRQAARNLLSQRYYRDLGL